MEKLRVKNGDIFEQQEVRGVEYAAMGCSTKAREIGLLNCGRVKTFVIYFFPYLYYIYVAHIRTCSIDTQFSNATISHVRSTYTCRYFFHLFFNSSDLPSIQLIQSGYRWISSSIFPRWDFFSIGTQKDKIRHVVIEMIFVRALLRATHVSSAVRCYEPSWSESWNDRFCWHVWHFYQKHCTLCLCKRHGASNRTERQTCCKFSRISICKSTERDSCCKFACISSCKSTERQTCCKFACISICKSTERQTCCNCEFFLHCIADKNAWHTRMSHMLYVSVDILISYVCIYIFSPTDNQAPWVEYVAMGCSTSCVAVCYCTVAVVALLLAHVSWQACFSH